MSSIRFPHSRRRLKILLASGFLALAAFGATEGMALASSTPTDAQLKAEDQAKVARDAEAALACAGAVHGRAAHRHFFTLAEARQCAPGAEISTVSRFELRILSSTNLDGYSRTVIVRVGTDQYDIQRLTVSSGAQGDRSVLAAGCPEVSTWNQGRWYLDTYINNQTRWQRNWNYCSTGAKAHVAYVSGRCQAFVPFYCATSTPYAYGDDSRDVYTDVQNNYVVCQILCFGSTTENAWQEMIWDSRGWWDYYGWFD